MESRTLTTPLHWQNAFKRTRTVPTDPFNRVALITGTCFRRFTCRHIQDQDRRNRKKVASTWDLTEERIGVFAEGSSHGRVQTGLAVTSRQLRPRVVPTLVVVVLDVEVDQLGEINT